MTAGAKFVSRLSAHEKSYGKTPTQVTLSSHLYRELADYVAENLRYTCVTNDNRFIYCGVEVSEDPELPFDLWKFT